MVSITGNRKVDNILGVHCKHFCDYLLFIYEIG